MGRKCYSPLLLTLSIFVSFYGFANGQHYKYEEKGGTRVDCDPKKISTSCEVTDDISGNKYKYYTCDNKCAKDKNTPVQAVFHEKRLRFATPCIVIGGKCDDATPCCRYYSYEDKKRIPDTKPAIACVQGACQVCIPNTQRCRRVKDNKPQYSCCAVYDDPNTDISCRDDDKTGRSKPTCNDFNYCSEKKLACQIPGTKYSSFSFCKCPDPDSREVQDGYTCQDNQCNPTCKFKGGPCQTDTDCCERNRCGTNKKCEFCYIGGSVFDSDPKSNCKKCCARNGCEMKASTSSHAASYSCK